MEWPAVKAGLTAATTFAHAGVVVAYGVERFWRSAVPSSPYLCTSAAFTLLVMKAEIGRARCFANLDKLPCAHCLQADLISLRYQPHIQSPHFVPGGVSAGEVYACR